MQLMIRQIGPGEAALLHKLLDCFGEAFEDAATYARAQPGDAYIEKLLSSENFIAVAALIGGVPVGGLTAYELKKFEQERSEIYIYDLAVAQAHRRKGIATSVIEKLKEIARARGAYVIYVQADLVDAPAIALYTKLGTREDVLHFDIEVE